MTEIRKHKDYRDFIKARLAFLKTSHPRMSFQTIATKLATTRSYMKLVTDKKRHMSLDKLIPLAKFLDLTDFETQYLIFLHLRTTSSSSDSKEFFNSILNSYSAFSRKWDKGSLQKALNPELKSVFWNWISMAILSLSNRSDYKHDDKWIHKKLGGDLILSLRDVQNAMKQMIEDGLIVEDENGLRPKASQFISDCDSFDLDDTKRFHSGLQRAALALNLKGKTPLNRPNRFHMYCLSLSHKEAAEVMRLQDQLIEKILKISKKTKKHERLIFVSNNAFAISEDDGK